MKNFNQFINQLKTARLSRRAKRTGWEYLTNELGLKPIAVWSWRIYAYAFLSLMLTIGLGTGISQAAGGAMPGDILYPIKTKIKEPVERALVVKTPAAKADFETELVKRRLDEAEQILQKEPVLEQTVKDELKLKIAEQTARAINQKSKVKEEKEENDLEVIFKEHEQVIKDLERKSEDKRHNKGKDKERD